MKPSLLYKSIVALFILCASLPQKTYASHSAGGELLYEWISDSTYRVILKFYRDCSGIPVSPQESLCITNTCGKPNIVGHVVRLLNKLPDGSPNGSVVSSGCPGYGNACTKPGSTIPGYQEWWYDDTVTLSGACSNWRFSVSINARNTSVNLSSGGNLFLEATLNTTAFPHNNSPVFGIKPVPYCLINLPYSYNNGVVDMDGDSLVFENIMPMSSSSSCTGGAATFSSATPLLNLTNNPFQTNNTYSLDAITGSMSFTPTLQGAQATTIEVKEYRNGMLVGTVVRDIQIQVLKGANPDSTFYDVDNSSLVNCTYRDGVVYACANRNVKLCYNVQSSYTGGQLVISDNHNLLFIGGTVSYNNQATNNVQGCYTFTTPNTPQKKNLLIIVKDSTCKPPTGIIFYQVLTLPIVISDTMPKLSVVKKYSYCQNDPAQPLSGSGTGLLWYADRNGNGTIIPPTPQTSTAGTITYYAEANNGCYSIWDTITVEILPKAEASIITSVDTVCINETMTLENKLHKQGVNYIWDTDNATIISNNSDKTLSVKWNTKGLKKVHLLAYNNKCNQSDSVYIYVTNTITGGRFTMNDSACVNEKVAINLDVKNNRDYLLQAEDTTIHGNTIKNYLLAWRTAGKKQVTLTTKIEGCVNNPYSKSITINPIPDATIKTSSGKICAGERVELFTEEQNNCKYAWYPQEMFEYSENYSVRLSTGLFNPIITSLVVTTASNCTNTDSLALTPGICCNFMLPNAFTPNEDGLNDLFGIVSFISVSEYKMIITNRWGQVVFKTNDINSKWNGTYNGKAQDIGTYSYYIAYKCIGDANISSSKGNLELIR